MATEEPLKTVADSLNGSDALSSDEYVRPPATMEGMALAYASLVIMALFPIFLGSVRSVKNHKEKKQQHKVFQQ